jgi:hypothetical protein
MTCWAMTLGPECRVCQHSATEHYHCRAFWRKRSLAQEGSAEGLEQEYRDAKQKNDESEKKIVDLGEKIAELDRDMEEQLTALGRLTATYASLCLNGRFVGQVKKSIEYLERHLEIMRQKREIDPEQLQPFEKSLDDMKERLKILQQVDITENGGRAGGRTMAKLKDLTDTVKGTVKSGMQAISTVFRPGRTPKRQGAPS